jgi:3-methylfumaryl-CoA hydratase
MQSDQEFITSVESLSHFIGSKSIVEDEVGLSMVRRISGMLDEDPNKIRKGDLLPPHWFGMFFPNITRQSDIGPDGHPKPGIVLPPIPLPRRMGAGRRVEIMGSLRAGVPAMRTTEVIAIAPKIARTGRITVLTLRDVIETEGNIIAIDETDAIYREMPAPGEKSKVTVPVLAPVNADWRDTITLTEALVFRYSAVTWNAHRIHYDADYSRDEEGYPATVQNGGLTMTLLSGAALKRAPGKLKNFNVRLTRPIHVGDTIDLCGARPVDGIMNCWVVDKDGAQCGLMELGFS